MLNITESASPYADLQNMSVTNLLQGINQQDSRVHLAVKDCIPQIAVLVQKTLERMRQGGRLFYIGAGTSGRLGVLDASELPPTFGVDAGLVIGLIAGGDGALRKAVENAEDDTEKAWEDMKVFGIGSLDTVVGIAASGTTPYVIGGIKRARKEGLLTGCIVCNPQSPLSKEAELPIEVVVGAEFVTGSTRMKSGTAQKLVLNMISTSLMIQLGKVKGNKMVNMQLTNQKLVKRGTKMLMDELQLNAQEAKDLLLQFGSVDAVLQHFIRLKEGVDKTGE